jgi:hypothetical protein
LIPATGRSIPANGITALNTALKPSEQQRGSRKKAFDMKKFGFATIAATAFAAALVGLAAPAEATTVAAPASVTFSTGIDHHQWINDIQQQVKTPPAPIVGNGR